MNTLTSQYPFDPSGVHPNNRVDHERHAVNSATTYIAPRSGTFYTDGIIIRHQDVILQPNIDYQFQAMDDEVVSVSGKSAAKFIKLLKSFSGELDLTYQAAGGKYEKSAVDLTSYYNRMQRVINTPHWNDTNAPEEIFPKRHLHHWKDVYGLENASALLERILRLMQKRILNDNFQFKLVVETMKMQLAKIMKVDLNSLSLVPEEVERLSTSLSALSQQLTQVDGSVSTKIQTAISTYGSLVDQKFATANNTIADHGSTLASHGTSLSELAKSIESLSNTTSQPLSISIVNSDEIRDVPFTWESTQANTITITTYKYGAVENLKSILDDVISGLDTLRDTVSQQGATIASHGTQLSTLSESLSTLSGSVTTVQQDLGNHIRTQGETNTGLSNRIAEVELANTQQSELLASHTQSVGDHGRKLVELQQLIDGLSNRLSTGTSDLEQSLTTLINGVKESLETAKTELGQAGRSRDDTLAQLSSQLSGLEEHLTQQSARLDTIAKNASSGAEGLQGLVNSLIQEQQNDRAHFLEMDQRLDALESQDSQTTEQLSQLSNQITQLAEKQLTAKNTLDELSRTSGTQGTTLQSLSDSLNEATQSLESLKSTVDGLSNATHVSPTEMNEVKQGLDTVKETLAQIQRGYGEFSNNANSAIQQNSEQYTALSAAVNEASRTISTIQSKVTAVETNLGTIGGIANNAISEASDATAQVASLSERVKDTIRYRLNFTGERWTIESGEQAPISIEGNKCTVISLGDTVTKGSQYDAAGLDVENNPRIGSSIRDGILQGRPQLFIVKLQPGAALPIITSSEEADSYVKKTALYRILSNVTTQHYRLANILKGFYQGIVSGQTASLYLLFSDDEHVSVNVAAHYGDSGHKFDIISHRINNQGKRSAVFEEDLTQPLQYNSMMANFLFDRQLRDSSHNYLKNGRLLIAREELVDWKLYESTGQAVNKTSINRIFSDKTPVGLVDAQYLHNTKLVSSASILLPSDTSGQVYEFTYTTTNPAMDITAQLELADISTGEEVVQDVTIPLERVRKYTTAQSSAVTHMLSGTFRVKMVTPEIPVQTGNRYYRLSVTCPDTFHGHIGQFCISDLRGSSHYIESDDATIRTSEQAEREIVQLVKTTVRQYITAQTQPNSESKWDLSRFREHPGAEDWSSISVDSNDNLVATGVILQKIGDDEQGHTVFTPTTTYTISETNRWRIPVQYRGRCAEVIIRAASVRVDDQIINSAVRKAYVVLPMDGAIDITVGALTSFGRYLTVNGNQDYSDAIYPRSYGLSMEGGLVTITV